MVFGGGPFGSAPFGGFPASEDRQAELSVGAIITPESQNHEGLLVRGTSLVWAELVQRMGADWSIAFQLSPREWEELVAGAFVKAGYDEVTLTPPSSDSGRDVIAIKRGVGSIKIIGSVKRYAAHRNVTYDDVRALAGVLSAESDASKGIITTTSDFPPNIAKDKFIASMLPTRLELINGQELLAWLKKLNTDGE